MQKLIRDDKAYGGLAGMLGERDGYHRAGIVHAIEEHKARINKMRELYGLFVKMESEVEGTM